MQSSYHNLPEIDGIMQQDGANFKATHVIIALEQDFASISMELASAYPINNLLYHRQITMNKNRQIIIEDSWDGCESVILNLMTYEKPYIHGSQLILVASETVVDLVAPEKLEATNIKNIPNILGIVDIMGSASIEIEEIPILDARLKQAWKHNIYRTRINATANSLTLTIH
jgi:hypothetical protein